MDAREQHRVRSYVEDLADRLFEERLAEWARADDGSLPTREDALREAQQQAATLIRALGPLKRQTPQLLDTRENRRARLRDGRNAWPKGEQESGFDEWFDL